MFVIHPGFEHLATYCGMKGRTVCVGYGIKKREAERFRIYTSKLCALCLRVLYHQLSLRLVLLQYFPLLCYRNQF